MDGRRPVHLTIDACTTRRLTESDVYYFLKEAPEQLDMTRIQPVVVAEHEGDLHGYCLIAESHISLHAENTGRVFVDFFSCKPFDRERATAFAIEKLNLTDVKTYAITERLNLSGPSTPVEARVPVA